MIDTALSFISILQGSSIDWNGNIIDLLLHVDKYLGSIIHQYGFWTYLILFVVVFCETGLVFTPFLPGDSLLFAAGSFAGMGALDPVLLILILITATILGDNSNYWIGNYVGPRVFNEKVRFLKREYLERTHKFYDRYGVKTVIIARFMPIIRTFAPFVAGIGKMSYKKFLPFDVIGGVLWVSLFVLAGYFFGTLEFVRNNFSMVVIAIIIISVLPILIEFLKKKKAKK